MRPLPPLITAADMARHAGRRVRMRGLAISYKRIPTKTGTWMKFLSLEDLTGTFEAVLFPDAYARCAEATLGTGPLLVEGRVDLDHGVPSLRVEQGLWDGLPDSMRRQSTRDRPACTGPFERSRGR